MPADLAERSAIWPLMHTSFDLLELSAKHGCTAEEAASAYWDLFEHLVTVVERDAALRRGPTAGRRTPVPPYATICSRPWPTWPATCSPTVAQPSNGREPMNVRSDGRAEVFAEIRRGGVLDLTTLSVALRQLRNLVLSTTLGA